ncbi:hypothetical protein AVMA1855_06085 [Acidovorax sp. SUPP1855]|uniref:RHS repeat-associated core domain-containing protein n=1 Tax=Acidovorax sp. SUPP1855 TaxID=431774 RepID=UPI0023DE2C84|nr:RHS repeat-associated core domain-containing protein [Acidovorax sp. SUPP1855]GKS83691.1 hypothetical protein AVMA1855_06085 [Acidovorax sp. SUPP1855]
MERSQGAVSSQYEYDPAGRLVHHRAGYRPSGNVQNSRAGTVLERVYAYDLSGQLVARGDTLRGRQDFRYDPTGRILAALPGAGSHQPRELFAFDPAGNLLDGSEAQVGRHHAADGRGGLGVVGDNRLRFYQDLHFEYDVHGNVIKRTRGNQKAGHHEVVQLRWNADHQLVEASTTRHGVTQTTRYAYDALGRRVTKADAFGTTHFLWDGDLMVLKERGGNGALFVYEPSSFVPLATVQGTQDDRQTYWYQCDQIGAPLELTDAQGRIAWAADYKVWGEATLRPVARTGTDDGPTRRRMGNGPGVDWSEGASARSSSPPPIEQPFRFQGQQFDEETGLHYNRFRYYDPAVGRFASQDPIGLFGNANTYSYAPSSSKYVDPLGLAPFKPCPCVCRNILAQMQGNGREYGTYAAVPPDSHHIIQNAAAQNIPGYSRSKAPAVQLGGRSTTIGSEHYIATQVQRQAGGGTYAAERRIGYKAIRRAGLSEQESKCLFMMHVDPHFNGLGVNGSTTTRIPGNR